jgi:putative membrane protein
MLANLLIGVVIAIHVYIVVLEMLLWTKPQGLKAFGLTPDFAEKTRVLAANQGLYNGFLATGLVFGLMQGEAGLSFKLFFLGCVIVAGIFGAATSSIRILFIQALPAALALAAVLLGI